MFRHLAIASWSCLCSFALAQEVPQHRLRVLTVGDPPPYTQEIRNGVRYEIPAATGTIPPRMVKVPAPKKPGETAEKSAADPVQMRLRLGQTSLPVTLPMPADQRLELTTEEGTRWLNVPLHSCGASLALVWRSGPDWSKASTLVMPDDSNARTEGNTHLSNLTAFPMLITIGSEKIRLEPGKTFTRRIVSGPPIPLEISYTSSSGGLRLCHSAALEATRGIFRRLVIYAADGKAPRNPIKVLQLEEPSTEPVPAMMSAR